MLSNMLRIPSQQPLGQRAKTRINPAMQTQNHPLPSILASDAEESVEAMQRRILSTPVRSEEIVIEWIEPELGIADGRQTLSGQRVGLNSEIKGIAFKDLAVGQRFLAHITQFHHVVEVEPLPPKP